MKSNRQRKKNGFANTKSYPHKEHPANYRRLSNDEIEYITFTHHPEVKIKNRIYKTIPLNSNINSIERINDPKSKSYAYPKRFVGKRSALGKERYDLSFIEEDKKKVDKLFIDLPTEYVRYSKKNRKK